jgi:hypothetical protein
MVSARSRARVKRRNMMRDVGEIVLGVLIALALGAVATQIGWEVDVWRAKQAIANELGEAVGQGVQRQRADRCIETKLASFAEILDEAEASGRFPAIGDLGSPLVRTWSTDVWDSTRNADIASQMDRETLDDLSGVYRFIADIDAATKAEVAAWTELFAIVGPGREADPVELRALRAALARARAAHRTIVGSSVWLDALTRRLELPVNRDAVRQYAAAPFAEHCAPIAPYRGERYGEAPFRGSAERARRLSAGGM